MGSSLGGAVMDSVCYLPLADEGELVPFEMPQTLHSVEIRKAHPEAVDGEDRAGIFGIDTFQETARRGLPVVLPQGEGDLRPGSGGKACTSGKEKVPLPCDAQAKSAAVAENPSEGIEKVALTASVRADDGREAGRKKKFGGGTEAFESLKMKPFDKQRGGPPVFQSVQYGVLSVRAPPGHRAGICSRENPERPQ